LVAAGFSLRFTIHLENKENTQTKVCGYPKNDYPKKTTFAKGSPNKFYYHTIDDMSFDRQVEKNQK